MHQDGKQNNNEFYSRTCQGKGNEHSIISTNESCETVLTHDSTMWINRVNRSQGNKKF